MELKQPTTYLEQLELLKEKNIVISDEASCLDLLSRVNYYRLSGYYLPYIDQHTKECFKPTDFNRIIRIYEFDTKLRSIVFSTIETIELYLRSQLSNYHALKYGAEGYLNKANFNDKHDHDAFLDHINSCIDENDKTLIVKHHKNKYQGHFPLWVIVEFFSMGMLSYFYRDMRNSDKSLLAESLYGVNYQALDSWMRCLTDLRNCCAHYSRIYYRKFSATPKMPDGVSYAPTRRVFAQLYMLKLMYPESVSWEELFYNPLLDLIGNYEKSISLKHLDFPYNWKELLKK